MDQCLPSVHPFQPSPFCAMASRDGKGKDRGHFLMLSALMPRAGCSGCDHQAVLIYPTWVMLAALKSWSSSPAQCASYAPRDLGGSREEFEASQGSEPCFLGSQKCPVLQVVPVLVLPLWSVQERQNSHSGQTPFNLLWHSEGYIGVYGVYTRTCVNVTLEKPKAGIQTPRKH